MPLVMTNTSIAFSPFKLGRMLLLVYMCMTKRILKRKQNQQIDVVTSTRYACRMPTNFPTGLRDRSSTPSAWMMVVVALNPIVATASTTDTTVVGTLYTVGHSRIMDHACVNSDARMTTVTGMLSRLAVAEMLTVYRGSTRASCATTRYRLLAGVVKYTASSSVRTRLTSSPAMLRMVGSRRKRARGVMPRTTTSIMMQAPICTA